jgi:U4/U6.U5 tri-snRNP-associated protein 1
LKGSKDLERREEAVGRAKDKRETAEAIGEDRIKIEYRDSMGRILTKKEAFRQLSYDFHGYGAGKAKTEKRMKVTLSSWFAIFVLVYIMI